MNAELSLHFAAVFLSYFIKVSAAYFACWILGRLLHKPYQRFAMWMIFLVGSAAWWLKLIFGEIQTFTVPTAHAGNPGSAQPVAHSFLLPQAWSHTILVAVQVTTLAYVSTALLLICAALWQHVRLRLLLGRAIEPSSSLAALFSETRRELGLSRGRLLVLPGLKSPATAGWWNPRILLPEVCEELGPTPQVADVLCHELIHVARRDFFWSGLGDFICCLLFFHPAVWYARKKMRLQGELACDLAVLATRPGDRADYADSLTYFVRLRMLQEGFSLGVDFAASASLSLRIRTILAAPAPLPLWKRLSQTAVGLALLAAFGIVAPALTIFLGFAQAAPQQASIGHPAQRTAEHARNSRHSVHRQAAQPQTPDTLTTLRVRPYVPETTAYTMTSHADARSGSAFGDSLAPVWQETEPAIHPSISSAIRSTLGEIAARTAQRGRDHDRDDR